MQNNETKKLTFPVWPQFNPKSYEEIAEPLKTGKVNYWRGKKGMEFEEKFAEWAGAKMAISCTNGTAALHIGISALGIGPGDEVIVPSYSFIASSFAILQAGAIPVFADVTEDHTIDPDCIEKLITKRTKGIVVVHLYGVVCDMDRILAIAKKHNLKVIEDCAQCIGGEFRGKKIGTVGDVGCFSFCQTKHFTTGGEGGMVLVTDEDLGWECRSFRDHGYNVRVRMGVLPKGGDLPYLHDRVGFNYRMTEIQSIIGINELERFETWNMPRRLKYAKMYDEALTGVSGIAALPVNTAERKNAYWWYPINLDLEKLDCTAQTIVAELRAAGVPCSDILWPEAYDAKAYREHIGFGESRFPFESKEYTDADQVDYSKITAPVAKSLRDKTVCLWLHPSWEEEHIQASIDTFKASLQKHAK